MQVGGCAYYSYICLLTIPVNYVLRGGELFNMVLLVPDDIPKESLASTVEGSVKEMCSLFEGWDPRCAMYK